MMHLQYKRITVKIGSNVLAREDGTLDVTRMSALVDQICALRSQGVEVIVITSGAVACGRSELRGRDLVLVDDVSRRQLFSAVGQVKLINRYYDLFSNHGVDIGQVLTMKENFSTRRHYLNQRNCMTVMLENGVVPVVNENDTVSVTELMFTDNDELSGLVAAMMDCDALVILSNIDGIYDGDPKDAKSKIIRTVSIDEDFSHCIQAGKSGFGRGGMVTKYNIARKVAAEGIEVIIANGKRDNILVDIFVKGKEDVPFTSFEPSSEHASRLKRWIAHSEGFAKGSIALDDKAVKVITSATASVLPVGVIAVDGDFDKDDLIHVTDASGVILGVGRSAYSADEARKVMGQRDCKAIIHYDYLYLNV